MHLTRKSIQAGGDGIKPWRELAQMTHEFRRCKRDRRKVDEQIHDFPPIKIVLQRLLGFRRHEVPERFVGAPLRQILEQGCGDLRNLVMPQESIAE